MKTHELVRSLEGDNEKLENLCGEILATITLAFQRGFFVLPSDAEESRRFTDLLRRWRDRYKQLRTAVCAEHTAELESLAKGIKAVSALIKESYGVAGLHLDGDVAPWGDLLAGGRFEGWLQDFSEAAETAGKEKP